MRIFNLLYLLLLLLLAAVVAPAPAFSPEFPKMRRRYHRHRCQYRRCMPLHSRVPFP